MWDKDLWHGKKILGRNMALRPGVENIGYLGILVTRKYFGAQKILIQITPILLFELICKDKYGYVVAKARIFGTCKALKILV